MGVISSRFAKEVADSKEEARGYSWILYKNLENEVTQILTNVFLELNRPDEFSRLNTTYVEEWDRGFLLKKQDKLNELLRPLRIRLELLDILESPSKADVLEAPFNEDATFGYFELELDSLPSDTEDLDALDENQLRILLKSEKKDLEKFTKAEGDKASKRKAVKGLSVTNIFKKPFKEASTELKDQTESVKNQIDEKKSKINAISSRLYQLNARKGLVDKVQTLGQEINFKNTQTIIVYNWRWSKVELRPVDMQIKEAVCTALRFALVTYYSERSLELKNETTNIGTTAQVNAGATGAGFKLDLDSDFIYDSVFIKSLITTVLTTSLPANLDEIMMLRRVARERCLTIVQEKLARLITIKSLSAETADAFVTNLVSVPASSYFYTYVVNQLLALLQTIRTNDSPPLQFIDEGLELTNFGIITVENLICIVKEYQQDDSIYSKKLELYMMVKGIIKNFKKDWESVAIIDQGEEKADDKKKDKEKKEDKKK
jgi:hypothetical protein